jgi:hypothetical protein
MLVTTMTENNNKHSLLLNDLNHGNLNNNNNVGPQASQPVLVTLGAGPKWCSWCGPLQLGKPRGIEYWSRIVCISRFNFFSTQGTGVGISRNPSDPASHGYDPKTTTLKIHFRVSASPNYITVRSDEDLKEIDAAQPSPSLPGWDAVLWRGRLYVSVSAEQLCHGSKEAFVSLLEYAEDVLRCEHVIVCLVVERLIHSNNLNVLLRRQILFLRAKQPTPLIRNWPSGTSYSWDSLPWLQGMSLYHPMPTP